MNSAFVMGEDVGIPDLAPAEAVALLSALVFQERSRDAPERPSSPRLAEACESLVGLARHLHGVQVSCGVEGLGEPDAFVEDRLKFGLVEVVYQWALGTSFEDITRLTDVMEGSIVRTVVRLDEQLRMVRGAARVMGDTKLYEKLEQASALIKRDVVFAASLYVQ